MSEWQLITASPEETVRAGAELAAALRPPVLVLLSGELGAGKTTLTKGIVRGLGAAREEEVTSPTFTLVHAFHNGCRVYHVDLYRIADVRDLESVGLEDVLAEPAVVVVEWGERMNLATDWPVVRIRLERLEDEKRRIAIEDAAGVLRRA